MEFREQFGHDLSTAVAAALAPFARTTGTVCPTATGKQWILRNLRREMEQICRCRGLRVPGFHVLRHTFGVRCAEASIPPARVQRWLGHQSLATTQLYYHDSAESGAEGIDLIGG